VHDGLISELDYVNQEQRRMSQAAATKERMALVERGVEEILTRDELCVLLEEEAPLKHYIGFEISGMIHLGTGLMCMSKVRDFIEAGFEATILLADWHSWINDKLGGDRAIIREVALGYFAEGMKASLRCVGGDPGAVTFVLGSDLYQHNQEYWATVVEVSKHTSLGRMQRSISILGRQEGEAVDFAKLLYPPMQVADIFVQGVTLAHAGMDQRKAHVIARDVARQLKICPLMAEDGRTKRKPVAIHHPLILGLGKPPVWPMPPEKSRDLLLSMKMSKSDTRSAIFIHDSPDEIRGKVRRAFCPPGESNFNPILDWARHLIFGLHEAPTLLVHRRHGPGAMFHNYEELELAYVQQQIHPMDLKDAVAERLIELLEPARRHFEEPMPRAGLQRLKRVLASSQEG
jgi:tyrosyl-tRNA synthetase